MRSLLVAVPLVLVACGDDVVCPSVGEVRITRPDGFAELVAGGTVEIAWTADGTPGASMALEAVEIDGATVVPLPPANLEDGGLTWDGLHPDGWAAPPANYRIAGRAGEVGGCEGVEVAGGDLHLIVVQGVRLPAEMLDFAGSDATRTFAVTTVSRSTLAIAYALAPDAGDALTILETTVPGELAPVRRTYPFTGMTAAGAAIPAGDYDLIAQVGAARVVGPRVRWRPSE